MFTMREYEESAQYMRERLSGFSPRFLLILGSGLGFGAAALDRPREIPFADVPHMRASTAPGHVGRFVAGRLAGMPVLLMQGRLHLYEGYSPEEAAYPVRVAKSLGCAGMVITNAAGGVNPSFEPGDIMLITDYIRLFAPSPLTGPNIDPFGPRFCDMSRVFTPEYQEVARQTARELCIPLKEGVYFYFPGPQFETPAEIRAARILGGDAVGMSTVPECIFAAHCGMKILGLSLITNMAAGILPKPLSGAEVDETAAFHGGKLMDFLKRWIEKM